MPIKPLIKPLLLTTGAIGINAASITTFIRLFNQVGICNQGCAGTCNSGCAVSLIGILVGGALLAIAKKTCIKLQSEKFCPTVTLDGR